MRKPVQPAGNWMHLTIAPLVEQRILGKEPLPGTDSEMRRGTKKAR